ncbi:MAG TPA: 3-hydroxyacyl-CoA dehydrogenase NAD-binding domain-containing protein [Longimicrobiaceae bacterium]|nr:3-hydroxyacyl-CoA dehydrogenase NAD-binding domain-containing protein [Longimicrobiaceae bacterium]
MPDEPSIDPRSFRQPDASAGAGRHDAPVDLELSVRREGIAVLTLRSRRGMSLPLRMETLRALESILAEVERLAERGTARILWIETAAPRPSLRGYDLEELRSLREGGITGWSREGQRILRRLEQLPIPSVAVIREEWLGGAAELALACSYRVASDTSAASIGFPQTRLGFLPAWGGTVRLPRLVGLRNALRLILTGESLHGDQAIDLGLLDRLFPGDVVDDELEAYALRRIERGRPRRRRRRSVQSRLMDETAPGRRLVVSRATRRYFAAAQGNLAARVALDLVRETVDLPLEQAFAREAEAAGELIVGTDAQGRLHSERLAERTARRTPIGPAEMQSIAVVGAGENGSDLAHLLVSAGMSVRIRGTSRARARDAVARVRSRVLWERGHGRISEQQARRRSGRVEGVSGYGGFGTLDLVVVAEDEAGPGADTVAAEVEAHVRPDCLIGIYDWTTSPSRLQRSLRHPDRVFAIHVALPSERFPLLEIAPGTLTAPATVAAARRLARRLSLTAIVVSDGMPTPATRLLGTFLVEAAVQIEEGIRFSAVDAACAAFGFDLGPFQRMDAIGVGRVVRMLEALAGIAGARFAPPRLLQELGEAGQPLYQYRSGRPSGTNPDLPPPFVAGSDESDGDNPSRRIVLALINEAARIVEEGGVLDPGDLDVISIFGLGFPRERGGLLFHAQEIRLPTVVDELTRLAHVVDERFAPAGLLRDLALGGGGFFGPAGGRSSGQAPGTVVE